MSSEKRGTPESNATSSSDEYPELNNQSKKQKLGDSDLVGEEFEGGKEGTSSEEEDIGYDYEEDYDSDYYDCESESDEDYHFQWRFGVKTPEIKLEEIESMLTVWKNGKMKIIETLEESEKLLEDIRSILVEARNVGKTTIEALQDKSCEQDEVFNEIQEIKDKIASQIKTDLEQDNLKLQGLQFKSFILQAQTEVLTKLAFAEIKRSKDLTKKSEDHERRILDLITSQKERLDYYDKMIGLTETDKEDVLKQLSPNQVVENDSLEMVTCVESVEFIEIGDKETEN